MVVVQDIHLPGYAIQQFTLVLFCLSKLPFVYDNIDNIWGGGHQLILGYYYSG